MEQDKSHKVAKALLNLYDPLDEVSKAIAEDTGLDLSLREKFLLAHGLLLDAVDRILKTYTEREGIGQELGN